MNCMFLFLTCAKLENMIPTTYWDDKFLKWKCAGGSKELSKSTWKLLLLLFKKKGSIPHQERDHQAVI